MRRGMTWKEFLFVLPLLLLVAVFSLYPIFSSGLYTLFDYQTNDQTRNKLYTGGNLNAELFYEDGQYLSHYLKKDIEKVDDTGKAAITALMNDITAHMAPYENVVGTLPISAADTAATAAFVDDVQARLLTLSQMYPDKGLQTPIKAEDYLKEMRSCVVGSNFIGLAGYQKLLQDSRFFTALKNTLVFTLISVVIELVLGMALALIMDKAVRGIGIVRTTSLIPWAIPTAVSALIWTYLYDGSSGIVARIFTQIGLIQSPELLLTTISGSMAAAVLADVWKTTPYMALLLLAGLQIIDRGLYESSAIDGAGAVRTFRRITLPMLMPSMLVALLFRTLDAFRVYDLIAVLTKGTPETLSIYAYKVMVGQSNYGYGSVIVLAMFLCVAAIAFLYVKVLGAELITDA
jgi:multiple sugar transport system permease protein